VKDHDCLLQTVAGDSVGDRQREEAEAGYEKDEIEHLALLQKRAGAEPARGVAQRRPSARPKRSSSAHMFSRWSGGGVYKNLIKPHVRFGSLADIRMEIRDLPLCPRKRTCSVSASTSAKCCGSCGSSPTQQTGVQGKPSAEELARRPIMSA